MNFIFHGEIIDYQYINSHKEKTILLLHGWGGDKNSFLPTIKILKTRFNILTLTMPTVNPTKLVWHLQDFKDLILNILSALNIMSISIVCHSFGFRVASLLNGICKIEKIVVTGGAGLKRKNKIKELENENNLILLRQKKFKYLFKKIASADYLNLSKINKISFKNIVNFESNKMIKFSCPMLAFWGNNDDATPISMGKKIAKKNKIKLNVVSGSHFAYLEHNAEFNNLVRNFL